MKKNRQINPLEHHFEKLVLAGVSLVLLAVVAMQFLTQPNAVKVGAAEAVPPDRVFDVVKREAEQLVGQMRSVNPELPEIPEQDVATRFGVVSELQAADGMALERLASSTTIASAAPDGGAFDAATVYAMPEAPVPAKIAAGTYRATVDPFVWASNEELRPYLPAQQPFDLAAVSIEGVVSGEALRQSLEQDPDGESGPLRPLPLSWWRGNLDMLGVEVEREEMDEQGGWGGAAIISGMPGAASLLKNVRREGVTPAELERVSQQAEAMIRQVAQPGFPETIAGPEWVRPSESVEDAGAGEEDAEVARLKKRVESLQRQIAARRQRLEGIGGDTGAGLESRGGGGRGVRQGGREGGSDRDARERDRLQKDIETLERELKPLLEQLQSQGEDVPQETARGEEEPPLPPVMEAKDLPVWVHDVTAEPGKTYRYRMRVVLNNPLFGRGQFLSESQQAAAASPVLEGAWSGWSAPIAMEADRHFFVVSASQNDALGSPPRASVEVYEFYYGYWRKGSTTLEPGDTVHARANLPDSLIIYDPAKLEELAAQNQTGRRDVPESGGGRVLRPEGYNERGRIEETGEPEPTTEEELPPGATKAQPWLDLSVPAMLLDVTRLPGTEERFQAVLRTSNGGISVRDAAADRARALYRRLEDSARAGETQGQPRPDPNANRPVVMPEEREDRRDYQRDSGGGGGGAGGG